MAGYDRRLRHPNWVSLPCPRVPPPCHVPNVYHCDRPQSTSQPLHWAAAKRSLQVEEVEVETSLSSRRTSLFHFLSVRGWQITSGAGMIVVICESEFFELSWLVLRFWIGCLQRMPRYRRYDCLLGRLYRESSKADFQEAMNETFLLSNMAPQVGAGFNRHCTSVL